jgi:hypothetical protein
MAALEAPFAQAPLEQSLGILQYGKYVRAPKEADFAYDKIEDLWSVEIEDGSDDEAETDQPETDILLEFYNRVKASKDKLFIIQMRVETRPRANWYVVQVMWDETSEKRARTEGKYVLRWYLPHHIESKKRIRKNCRWWPEIHEKRPDGSQGRIRMINPSKATKEYVQSNNWEFYEWEMDLFKDKLVGPFNFTRENNENNRIPLKIWQELEKVADPNTVYLGNLRRVEPLN